MKKAFHSSLTVLLLQARGIFLTAILGFFVAETSIAANSEVSGGLDASMSGSSAATSPLIPSVGVTASAGDSSTMSPAVIVRYGDHEIKAEELGPIFEGLNPSDKEDLSTDPSLLKKMIYSMVVERIVMAKVEATHWDEQPDIKARLETLRRKAITESYLKSVTEPPADYPSDAELRSAYEAAKPKLMVPHRFKVAQIFIALPKDASKDVSEKAQKKLEEVVKNLNQPDADFGTIAQKYSDEKASAAHNGDMGWVADEKMPHKIYTQVLMLSKNGMSNPVRIDDGWHIIKLLDFKDVSPVPFEDVKVKLTQQLRAARSVKELDAYVNQLLKDSPVTVNDKALAKMLSKPAH